MDAQHSMQLQRTVQRCALPPTPLEERHHRRRKEGSSRGSWVHEIQLFRFEERVVCPSSVGGMRQVLSDGCYFRRVLESDPPVIQDFRRKRGNCFSTLEISSTTHPPARPPKRTACVWYLLQGGFLSAPSRVSPPSFCLIARSSCFRHYVEDCT